MQMEGLFGFSPLEKSERSGGYPGKGSFDDVGRDDELYRTMADIKKKDKRLINTMRWGGGGVRKMQMVMIQGKHGEGQGIN